MSKKEENLSRHHICPRSRLWSNDKQNIILLKNNKHQALHTLFANQLIAQQLLTTIDISRKAMRPEVVERLIETLTAHDESDLDFWYKDNTHF